MSVTIYAPIAGQRDVVAVKLRDFPPPALAEYDDRLLPLRFIFDPDVRAAQAVGAEPHSARRGGEQSGEGGLATNLPRVLVTTA